MLEKDHGARQLATLVLQQLRTTHGEDGDCGEQLAQPARSAGIERQDAAASSARQIKEKLGVPARGPVSRVVEDDEFDAPAPKLVGQFAATCRGFLKNVTNVGDDPDARRGERVRKDRQELGLARDTGDGCGAVAEHIRVSGELGEGMQAGAAVDGKSDIEFAGQRAHEGVGDLASRGPGWLAGRRCIEAKDKTGASRHGGAGEYGWVRGRYCCRMVWQHGDDGSRRATKPAEDSRSRLAWVIGGWVGVWHQDEVWFLGHGCRARG